MHTDPGQRHSAAAPGLSPDQRESLANLYFQTPRHTHLIIDRFGLLEQKSAIACVDLELTCWPSGFFGKKDPRQQEIIEIGVVLLDAQSLRERARLSALIRPAIHPQLDPYCTQLTGITQREVDSAEPFSTVWPAFAAQLPPPKELVWAAFGSDTEEIETEIFRAGQNPLEHIDPRYINVRLCHKALFPWKTGGLDDVLNQHGLEIELPRHRALPDAAGVARLIQKLSVSPLDAAVSRDHTYRERLEGLRDRRAADFARQAGIEPEEARQLLPLFNWGYEKARRGLALMRKMMTKK